MADHVVALSHFVANRLVRVHGFPEHKVSTVFHPDLDYSTSLRAEQKKTAGALRILFAGRVLAYKGLPLLVEAMELLRSQGVTVELGVCGRGDISKELIKRLSALGASITNRWLTHDELADAFSKFDVVVAPHVEASQSGVVAASFGAGLPVIVTPVGGLVEQVTDGITGLISEAPTPESLAAAIARLANDRLLLARLIAGVAATRHQRSMLRFFDDVCSIALAGASPNQASGRTSST